MLYGCDISKWQGISGMNTAMYPENCEFVIVKATEGVTIHDPAFTHNMQNAMYHNKLVGCYHYARPDLNSPEKEAEFFYNAVREYIGKAILVLDWEMNIAASYPQTWAISFLNWIWNNTGVKPFIYTSAAGLDYIPVVLDVFPLWVAEYTGVPFLFKYTGGKIKASEKAIIHQYTSKPLDLDAFKGTREEWEKYASQDDTADDSEENNCPSIPVNECDKCENCIYKRFFESVSDLARQVEVKYHGES